MKHGLTPRRAMQEASAWLRQGANLPLRDGYCFLP